MRKGRRRGCWRDTRGRAWLGVVILGIGLVLFLVVRLKEYGAKE